MTKLQRILLLKKSDNDVKPSCGEIIDFWQNLLVIIIVYIN